jgi:Na+/H+-dicarboxylate symporter
MDSNRLFGGNPMAVIIRLVVISIIVGIVLSALNIRPDEILYHISRLIERLSELGFDWVVSVFRWFLVGAVVVIPVWLIVRLFGMFSNKPDGDRR